MTSAYVTGVGVWTPEVSAEPSCALLPSRLARRASLLTRMAAAVMAEAAPAEILAYVPTVYGTAYGESETLVALLEMLTADGQYSPARFSGSVNNTASGTLSIATGNRAVSTAISAGNETVAMGLLECFGLLDERGGEVLLVLSEEAPGAPFNRPGLSPMATAFLLSREKRRGSFARLDQWRRGSAPCLVPPAFSTTPVAPSLGLVSAIRERRAGPIALSFSTDHGCIIDVIPEPA